jgi:hypothetical protein
MGTQIATLNASTIAPMPVQEEQYQASVLDPFDGTPGKTKTFFRQLHIYFMASVRATLLT